MRVEEGETQAKEGEMQAEEGETKTRRLVYTLMSAS
jgi:hypothetical protein